jgi:S-phase kinase-associated protein 1
LGLEDTEPDNPIAVQVKGDIFAKVIEYCRHAIENPAPKEEAEKKPRLELSDWDKKFCDDMDQKTLFAVILAANFLDVKPLLDCTCLYIALKLKSMTPEEIRKEYNITKEFTPEEEEKARKEFEDMILQNNSKQ